MPYYLIVIECSSDVVASVRGSVLELVAHVAQRRVLQALPQCVDDNPSELGPRLRCTGQGCRNDNHFLHLKQSVRIMFLSFFVCCDTYGHIPVVDRLAL